MIRLPPQYFKVIPGDHVVAIKHVISQPFKRQSYEMAKHTHAIRRQFADELFECLAILLIWRLNG